MKAAIIQSSFFPWKGYFDIIHDVDVFVFLEDVQYTVRDWRNRNKIKTPGGINWITVPVSGSINQKLFEVKIDNAQDWMEKHKKTIHRSYASSRYYEEYKDEIYEIYEKGFEHLSDLNRFAIKKISGLLGIETEFMNSTELNARGTADDRLIEICHEIGAGHYLSGPSAKDYIDETKFDNMGIMLEYKDYSGYPEYQQLWGGFEHHVSIIDVIFNCGDEAAEHIWEWRNGR